MEKSKISNQRLNKHKIECNQLKFATQKSINIIKELKPTCNQLDNITASYSDKIYEIYSELEKNNIDFWDNSFELRDAVLLHLKEKLGVGLSSILLIGTKIASLKQDKHLSRSSKWRKNKQIRFATEKLHISNEYIRNYDIKLNINETLLSYYNNMIPETLKENDLIVSYFKMKANIRQLGIENELICEPEIVSIIKIKEEQIKSFEEKSQSTLDSIYEDLGVSPKKKIKK